MLQTNPNKPGEIETINASLNELDKCRSGYGWNLAKLDIWLKRFPDIMNEAAQSLNEALEQVYPPEEVLPHERKHQLIS